MTNLELALARYQLGTLLSLVPASGSACAAILFDERSPWRLSDEQARALAAVAVADIADQPAIREMVGRLLDGLPPLEGPLGMRVLVFAIVAAVAAVTEAECDEEAEP